MKEFIIDKEYKFVLKDDGRNIWDVYQNGKLISSRPDKLFKFYSLNSDNIDALLRHYFYLANPGGFNDPFDCNVNLIEDLGDIGDIETVKRNNYSNVGICCLSENIDNHLMWAHYTNNYYGFALEFKDIQARIEDDSIAQHALTKVIYPKKPIRVNSDYQFAHQYVLTTKFKHWEYEQEWRIITHLLSENRELEYYKDIVSGIYIGHNIPDTKMNQFYMLLEIVEINFPNIPVYVVYPHPNELKLIFEKMPD